LLNSNLSPQDVARSLTAFTANTIADALINFCPQVDEVYLCGGGARNSLLVSELRHKLPNILIEPTDTLGVGVDWVEAAAFAWLAHQTMEHLPGNLPAVTGAKGQRILGAIYQA
jgi:anhydro-N-acetylmuramic acid kinase